MTALVLVISALACVAAAPFPDGLLARLPVSTRADVLPLSPETAISAAEESPKRKREAAEDEGNAADAANGLAGQSPAAQDDRSSKQRKDPKGRNSKKSRKHKAFFLDVPFAQQVQPYPRIPSAEQGAYDFDSEGRNRKKYQDSNIYYIRLPPTPYSYIPGLGYISQPPTYSTAGLRSQIAHSKPPPRRPQPHHKPANPFINLPIDFVSNGKPTSVYQWQPSKPSKRPDSPITNLDNLSAGFVSNGKPTSVYQWHSKPAKRPSATVNTLDNGPYVFNGRPTSLYLLNPDGSKSAHQPIRYTADYRQQSTYY